MVSERVSYRARVNVSFPKDEAAAKRIRAGKAKPDDWRDVAAGKPCSPPPSDVESLLASAAIEEVSTRG